MAITELERRIQNWLRYVASIPHAVARYREASSQPSDNAIARYEAGLWRYAKVLENAATAHTLKKR